MTEASSFADLFVNLDLPPSSSSVSGGTPPSAASFLTESAFPSPDAERAGAETEASPAVAEVERLLEDARQQFVRFGAAVHVRSGPKKAGDAPDEKQSAKARPSPSRRSRKAQGKGLPSRQLKARKAKGENTPPRKPNRRDASTPVFTSAKRGTLPVEPLPAETPNDAKDAKDAGDTDGAGDAGDAKAVEASSASLPTSAEEQLGPSGVPVEQSSEGVSSSSSSLPSVLNAAPAAPTVTEGSETVTEYLETHGKPVAGSSKARIKDLCDADRAKVARLVRKLAVTVADRDASRREVALIKEEVAREEGRRSETRITKLKKQNAELVDELQRTKAKLTQSTALLKKVQTRTSAEAVKSEKIQALQRSLDTMKARVFEQEKELEGFEQLKAELSEARGELRAQSEAKGKLQEALEAKDKEVQVLQERVSELTQEKAALHRIMDERLNAKAGEIAGVAAPRPAQDGASAVDSRPGFTDGSDGQRTRAENAVRSTLRPQRGAGTGEAWKERDEGGVLGTGGPAEAQTGSKPQSPRDAPSAPYALDPSPFPAPTGERHSASVPAPAGDGLSNDKISEMLDELASLRDEVASLRSSRTASIDLNRHERDSPHKQGQTRAALHGLGSPPRPVRRNGVLGQPRQSATPPREPGLRTDLRRWRPTAVRSPERLLSGRLPLYGHKCVVLGKIFKAYPALGAPETSSSRERIADQQRRRVDATLKSVADDFAISLNAPRQEQQARRGYQDAGTSSKRQAPGEGDFYDASLFDLVAYVESSSFHSMDDVDEGHDFSLSTIEEQDDEVMYDC